MAEDITGLGKVAEQLPELTKELRELITILFKPTAEEFGGIFGDYFKRVRERNAIRGLAKTQEILVQQGIKTQAIKTRLLVPIIEGMSLEEDDDLQTMWAKLLAEAIKTNNIRPNYSSILKALSPLDAKILTLIYKKRELFMISAEYRNKSFYEIFPEARKYEERLAHSGRGALVARRKDSESEQYKQYDIAANNRGRYERNEFNDIISLLGAEIEQSLPIMQESIDNLCHLGLCVIENKLTTYSNDTSKRTTNGDGMFLNYTNFKRKFYLTYLGENFISIVNNS